MTVHYYAYLRRQAKYSSVTLSMASVITSKLHRLVVN